MLQEAAPAARSPPSLGLLAISRQLLLLGVKLCQPAHLLLTQSMDVGLGGRRREGREGGGGVREERGGK